LRRQSIRNGVEPKRLERAWRISSFLAKYAASDRVSRQTSGMATVTASRSSSRTPMTFTSWPVSGKVALNAAELRNRSTASTRSSVGLSGA
jgi:hypothetical protein